VHFYSFSSFIVVGTIRTSCVQGVIFGELLKGVLSNFKFRIVIQVWHKYNSWEHVFYTSDTLLQILLNRCLYYVQWVSLTVYMPWMYVGQQSFFNSTLEGGERLMSLPLALRPGDNLGTHRIGWWVGHKVTLYILRQKKIFTSWNSKQALSSV